MNRMAFILLALLVSVAAGQAYRDVGGAPATPPAAAGPGFPGAGTVLGTQGQPFFPAPPPPAPQHTPDSLGSTWDRSRSVCWFGDQNRNASPAQPSLFAVTPTIPHAIPTTIVCYDAALISAPGTPVTSGAYTGVGIVPSRMGFNGPRTVLAVDFNGDVARFDDHIIEIDPSVPATGPGAANAVNIWYLDSSSCPASCRPNGNIDVPQRNINYADGVLDVDFIPGEAASPNRCVMVIRACMDFRLRNCTAAEPLIYLVNLIPGGAWSVIATLGPSLPYAPFQDAPNYAAFDPTTQSYFLIDNGDGNTIPNFPPKFYEAKWNAGTMGWRVLQSFPAYDGFVGGMSMIEPSAAPHYMKAPGRRTSSIGSLDTGEVPLSLSPAGTTINLVGGAPNANKVWILAVALSANFGFDLDRERHFGLDPDPLFFLSLLGIFGNQGVLDGSGNGSFVMPPLPTGFTLQLQGVLIGNASEDRLGVERFSTVTPYMAP